MKKQSPIKRLYEPSHPILGKIVLSAGILLAVISCVLGLQHQSELLFLTKQRTLPATATPAPALNPAYFTLTPTPTLAPGQKAIYTFYIQATSHKTSNEELTL